MARRKQHPPLRVLLNNRHVGNLLKEADGAIKFDYEESWLAWDHAVPVSLSLPLRESIYRGRKVVAVFDNLLPDSDAIRRRVAERVGAESTDAYSMLAAIGHDCVGALQFIADGDEIPDTTAALNGTVIDDNDIEKILRNLAQAPLGLNRDDDFRISVAGAQEKTALLHLNGQWLKPHGTTPTTHIFKKQIGQLPNGVDLSNSVENEYYCLKLMEAFGLPANDVAIATFGDIKALIVTRFDRQWTNDGRLLRLPQEDCCQALSVPPTQKYQADKGPGIVSILNLLRGSDKPAKDQKAFLKAQLIFWLIGATDGHAKNFSVFLGSEGRYNLTPFYDILTAQPSLDDRHFDRNQTKLAMSVGKNRHYRIETILGRHFIETADEAKIPKSLAVSAIEEVAQTAEPALEKVQKGLPLQFPESIHASVSKAVRARLRLL